MAPEQAKGAAVDKRADIWAFGVVLLEMLSGKRVFDGDSVPETLAGVLKSDIDFSALPPGTPRAIRRLLRRCLERNPRNRLHDIADARIVLEEVAAGDLDDGDLEDGARDGERADGRAPPTGRGSKPAWRLLPWAITALALAALAAFAYLSSLALRSDPSPVIRFEIAPPDTASSSRRGNGFEISPDGKSLAVTWAGELWVRELDELSFRRFEGITDATYPFWSPDGAWIGFFAEGRLQKVLLRGGRAQRICDAPEGRGATWAPDDTIVFTIHFGSTGLWQVSAQGGRPQQVTALRAGHGTPTRGPRTPPEPYTGPLVSPLRQ
jgi:serine/threonine-protein kinase